MLSLIVAMDKNGLIGKGNTLPWSYPEDLAYFKKITTGKSVLMGYNTYLSICDKLGGPLPDRTNFVLTTEKSLPNGGIIVTNLPQLIHDHINSELVVIGGRSVYEQLLPYVERMYITRINKEYEGDVYFPEYNKALFNLASSETSGDLTFEVYDRMTILNKIKTPQGVTYVFK